MISLVVIVLFMCLFVGEVWWGGHEGEVLVVSY